MFVFSTGSDLVNDDNQVRKTKKYEWMCCLINNVVLSINSEKCKL